GAGLRLSGVAGRVPTPAEEDAAGSAAPAHRHHRAGHDRGAPAPALAGRTAVVPGRLSAPLRPRLVVRVGGSFHVSPARALTGRRGGAQPRTGSTPAGR